MNFILCWVVLIPISVLLSHLLILFGIFIKNKVRLIKNLNFDIKINKLKNSKNSLSAKLQELNTLKEQGLITEENYNNKKSQLLDEF